MIELIKEEKRKRNREGTQPYPKTLTQRAATLVENWCKEFNAYFGYEYYPSAQDLADAEHYGKFITWEDMEQKVKWFLKHYLRTPQGRVEAMRRKTIFAPTLSMFFSSLNDIPLVMRGYTPNGFTVDEDGEVRRC